MQVLSRMARAVFQTTHRLRQFIHLTQFVPLIPHLSEDIARLALAASVEVFAAEPPTVRVSTEYEEAILRRRFPRLPILVPGHCNVCGDSRGFPLWSNNFREGLPCPGCANPNRKRQMVAVLANFLGLPWDALPEVRRARQPKDVWVLETGSLATEFPGSVASEYLGDTCPPGSTIRGIRHEDAMRPSFPDSSLDLVLSSDVFEHIPDPYMAHAEVFRCLRPGGVHIFTVPFLEDAVTDDIRATVCNGVIQYHKEPVYHGDPLRPEGALVYILFSRQMLDRLNAMGYKTAMYRVHSARHAILGANGIVFAARKPPIAGAEVSGRES